MLGQTREGLEKGGEKELEAIVVGEKEKEWRRISSLSRKNMVECGEACSGSLAHRRVGDRACLTCRCACGGGVVVWWEEERAGGEDGGRRRAGGQQKCGHSRAQLRTREHFIICGPCRGAAASEFQGA